MLEILNHTESKEDVSVTDQDLRVLGELQLVLIGGGTGDATLC
jgi:hypothetical protein